jgi:hypothetical protein
MRMAAATRNADKEKPMRKRTARYGGTPVPSSLEAAWMACPAIPRPLKPTDVCRMIRCGLVCCGVFFLFECGFLAIFG